MSQEERMHATVQAMVLLQCYVHLHDKTIENNGITQKTKMLSKALVAELEKKDFRQVSSRLCKIGEDGMAYVSCIETVERLAESLSKIPFQYWDDITDGIDNLRSELIDKGEISHEMVASETL